MLKKLRNLRNVRVLRVVWPMWIIFCIILSNGYKGIVVNDLIAPLTQETPQTIDEVFENKFRVIYSDPAVTEYDMLSHILFKANITPGTQFKGALNKLHMQAVYVPYFLDNKERNYLRNSSTSISEPQYAALIMCESTDLQRFKKCYDTYLLNYGIQTRTMDVFLMLCAAAKQILNFFEKNTLQYVIQSLEWLSTNDAREVLSNCDSSIFIVRSTEIDLYMDRVFTWKSFKTRKPFKQSKNQFGKAYIFATLQKASTGQRTCHPPSTTSMADMIS